MSAAEDKAPAADPAAAPAPAEGGAADAAAAPPAENGEGEAPPPAPVPCGVAPCVDLTSTHLKIDHFDMMHGLGEDKKLEGAPNFRQVREEFQDGVFNPYSPHCYIKKNLGDDQEIAMNYWDAVLTLVNFFIILLKSPQNM